MSPKNNDNNPKPQKIIVEKRGMLPQSRTSKNDDEKSTPDADIEAKEKRQPLADHKVKLEPDEDGSINAMLDNGSKPKSEKAGASDKKAEPADKPPVQPAKNEEAQTPTAKPTVPKPDPEEAAKKEAVEKLIAEKKYAVPITHNKSHRSKRQFVLTFLVVLIVGLFAINLAIDAGVIKTSINPIVNLINN